MRCTGYDIALKLWCAVFEHLTSLTKWGAKVGRVGLNNLSPSFALTSRPCPQRGHPVSSLLIDGACTSWLLYKHTSMSVQSSKSFASWESQTLSRILFLSCNTLCQVYTCCSPRIETVLHWEAVILQCIGWQLNILPQAKVVRKSMHVEQELLSFGRD